MDDDFKRKVAERYGNAPFNVLRTFAVPNTIEGGGGLATVIEFINSGKVTLYMRTRGLWAESDAPELESYFAKQSELPIEVVVTVATLNNQKHGTALAPTPSTEQEAAIALLGAEKHHAYIEDPTPPDLSPDIIDDGERNADMSPL